MANEAKTAEEIRYEWSEQDSRTRQTRIHLLQKLVMFGELQRGTAMKEILKAVLPVSSLERIVSAEGIAAYTERLNDPKTYNFTDLVKPLGIFRPFEIAMFREAVYGAPLYLAFADLEAYYVWMKENQPSAYGHLFYRMSMLIGAGLFLQEALEKTGEEDYLLHELTVELGQYATSGMPLAEFWEKAEFPEWQILLAKGAAVQGYNSRFLLRLAEYSVKNAY